MELFLNLLWVMMAGAILGLWRTRWMGERSGRRRNPLHEGIALGCALVFLFFAVSLSDDLHAAVVLFDESSTGRRHTVCAHLDLQPGNHFHGSGFAILPRVPAKETPREVEIVVAFDEYGASSLSLEVSSGRSPPA